MGYRRRMVMACIAIATSFALTGTASSKSVERASFQFGPLLLSCEIESTSPLVRDEMIIFGVPPQHTVTIERVYNPTTLRGTMTAHVGTFGAEIQDGTMHGVITPEGMSGTIQMTRFREDGLTDKFVGTWFAEGRPDTACEEGSQPPFLSFRFFVEGHYIIS